MNISELPQKARLRAPEWKKFYAKNKRRLAKLDREIELLHEEACNEIDCLACGNCCRSLGPMILSSDIDGLTKPLRMKAADIMNTYLRTDEDGDMVFKEMPCPFLGTDNYCAVYQNRPKACREYPHTDRKKFHQIFNLSIKNAETCPIVFKVLEGIMAL